MNYGERARHIIDGDGADLRHKVVTLAQIRKWRKWRDPGKDSGQRWNDGEWMLAFEDGSVTFQDGGGTMSEERMDPEELADWIKFLDGVWFPWH